MCSIHLIIVSDTCFKDPSKDKVIPAIQEVIKIRSKEFFLKGTSIIPDEKFHIQSEVISRVRQGGIDLILTAGGTGFSARDVTPEAVEVLLERKAPGLVQLMIQDSLKITPMAVLSRPVAGTIGDSIVATLPGSPKGASENFISLVPIIPHALDLIRGVNNSHNNDKSMSQTQFNHKEQYKHQHNHIHSHSHSHGHHNVQNSHPHGHHSHQGPKFYKVSNDLSLPVTERARSSPYPMVSVNDALELIKKAVPEQVIEERSIKHNLIGYVVAEDIISTVNVPGYRASIVDGYAVGNYKFPESFVVSNISHANSMRGHTLLQPNTIARVTTGAPIPEGTFAVIPVENTLIESTRIDGDVEEENKIFINIDGEVGKGDNVREPGSDVKKGDLVIAKGTEITSVGGEIGLLASIGCVNIKVFRKPVIGVMSTGDEVVEPSSNPLTGGQIWDSNRPSLIAACKAWNFEVIDLGIVKDVANDLESSIRNAYSEKGVDLVITTGGVSMGEMDLLKPTIERALDGTIHFGRVAMKPGKPTTFASLKEGLIFGLPGNPASALVTLHLFVLPCLRLWSGKRPDQFSLPTVKVKLSESVRLDPRPEYHRVFISQNDDGILCASSTGGQRSSRVGSVTSANGLLCLPPSVDKNINTLESGEFVDAIVIGSLK